MFYTYKLSTVHGTNKNCRAGKEQDSATQTDAPFLIEENKNYNKIYTEEQHLMLTASFEK